MHLRTMEEVLYGIDSSSLMKQSKILQRPLRLISKIQFTFIIEDVVIGIWET